MNIAIVGATGNVGRKILEVLEKKKLDIDNLYLLASSRSAGSKINFNGKKFDVVFLLQVFEHISNPQNLLNQIKKCLNENGIIYIEVPNINDALYSIYNLESYVEFNFRLPHVYYYSDITLEKMLSSCDFKGETL